MIPPDIMAIITAGGSALSPFLFYLWFTERAERREAQIKLGDLSERTLILMTELKGLVTGRGAGA